jgi:hypothetical protein
MVLIFWGVGVNSELNASDKHPDERSRRRGSIATANGSWQSRALAVDEFFEPIGHEGEGTIPAVQNGFDLPWPCGQVKTRKHNRTPA